MLLGPERAAINDATLQKNRISFSFFSLSDRGRPLGDGERERAGHAEVARGRGVDPAAAAEAGSRVGHVADADAGKVLHRGEVDLHPLGLEWPSRGWPDESWISGQKPKVRQSARRSEQRDVDHAIEHCGNGVGGSKRKNAGSY